MCRTQSACAGPASRITSAAGDVVGHAVQVGRGAGLLVGAVVGLPLGAMLLAADAVFTGLIVLGASTIALVYGLRRL